MGLSQRYPLPVAVFWLGLLVSGVGTGYLLWKNTDLSIEWVLAAGAVAGFVVGSIVAVCLFQFARLVCAWFVCVWTPSFNAHANLAALTSRGAQEDGTGRRDLKPLQVAKLGVGPKIRNGALWVPIRTDSGGLGHGAEREKVARDLSNILSLGGASRVEEAPLTRSGYPRRFVWFILSRRDVTAG